MFPTISVPLNLHQRLSGSNPDGTIPPELYEKYISRVISETERLHKLTESMLTLNSLDARGYLTRTNFDINRVIKDTAASFEGTCGKKYQL